MARKLPEHDGVIDTPFGPNVFDFKTGRTLDESIAAEQARAYEILLGLPPESTRRLPEDD